MPERQGYEPPNERKTISSLKKIYNVTNKSNEDHYMELVEQSEEELLNSELEDNALPEQNHTIAYTTRNTVDRLAREHLHLKCQNEQTGAVWRYKSKPRAQETKNSMKLMYETSERLSKTNL